MLNFYVLVCVLLVAGSEEQPFTSSMGSLTTPAPTSNPIIEREINCDPISDESCHASPYASLEDIAKEAKAMRFSTIYVNITISHAANDECSDKIFTIERFNDRR
jgi:hypothetical protein